MAEQNLTVLPPEETEYPLLNPANMQNMLDIFRANVGSQGVSTLDLPRIKCTPGGGTIWVVKTLTGDESAKEIEGIILSWRTGRLYWQKTRNEGGGKKPPDCVSKDGYIGVGNPGGTCADCPYSKFGSSQKGGRGQACKQIRQVLIVRPGEALPYLLTVPPTSLRGISQYFLMLWGRQVPYWGVTTKITLQPATSEGGDDYAKMQFAMGRMLNAQEVGVLKPYQARMSEMLAPMTVDTADYEVDDELVSKPRGPKPPAYTRTDRPEENRQPGDDEIPF